MNRDTFFEPDDTEVVKSYRALVKELMVCLKALIATNDPTFIPPIPSFTDADKKRAFDRAKDMLRQIEGEYFNEELFLPEEKKEES